MTPTVPSTEAMVRLPRRGRRPLYWLLGVAGAGLAFLLVVGFATALTQEHRLATYRPTQAFILSGSVESVRAAGTRTGDTYLPVVRYRYIVDHESYTGTRVTPLGESRDGGWAWRLERRFPPGGIVVAWYDPDEPASSFLVRERSLVPYLFIACPLLLLIGCGWLVQAIRRIPARGHE